MFITDPLSTAIFKVRMTRSMDSTGRLIGITHLVLAQYYDSLDR